MTRSEYGQAKTLGRKQSRLWLALFWAALTVVAVVVAFDGRLLWWFIAACFAAFGGYWFYLWRNGK